MKKSLIIIAMVSMLALTGCVIETTYTPLPMDTRVTIAPDLGVGWIYISSVRCLRNESGFICVQANVVNNLDYPIAIEWKVQWLDAAGLEIESAVSTWSDIALAAREIKGLKAVSNTPAAADMRIYFRCMSR